MLISPRPSHPSMTPFSDCMIWTISVWHLAARVELATTFRSSGTRIPRLAKQHETCGGTGDGHLASGSVARCRCSCSNAVDVLNCGVEKPTLVRELLRSGHGLDRRCFAHHHSSQARPKWFSFDAKEASVTTALASVVRNVKRAHCSSSPTSVVDKPMVPPSNRCRVARDDACGTGYWQPCPQGRAHRWRGETTCAWQPATQQRLLAALVSLKARGLPPEIVFFGDSTFRQLYLDALYLGTAANGTADDPSCDPKQARDVELPRGTIITKLGPVVAGETASLLDPRGAGPEAHASGCNVRILREHNALPIPGGGRLRFYFSGQLSCHEPEHQRSLFSILAGGCPGAIVAGHNIWDCRWHQMARMPWPQTTVLRSGRCSRHRLQSSQVLRRPQVSFSVIARLLVPEQLSRHVLQGGPVGPSQQALQHVRSRL